MAFKCTMILGYTSQQGLIRPLPSRSAGKTESWYATGGATAIQSLFNSLCEKRAAMLPGGASIVGQRIQPVQPNGPTSSRAAVYPGSTLTTMAADIPQMALRLGLQATDGINQETRIINMIPDTVVVQGEYSPNPTFQNALADFASELVSRGWRFQGIDKTNLNVPLVSVDTAGQVTSITPHGLAVNDFALITRAVTTGGIAKRILSRVIGVTDATHFKVLNPPVFNLTGGYVRKYAITQPQIAQVTVGRVTTRKVGRPSDAYRGRASKRRR